MTSVANAIFQIRKPHDHLFRYYLLVSLLFGPFFFVALIPLYFRFRTLEYSFDDEGISMRWGILFRREISLTYARIQDIHLASNIVERWLGLARIKIQTASGNSGAEMTIEGLKEFGDVRDFLYSRMRGSRAPNAGEPVSSAEFDGSIAATLRLVADEIRQLRESLEKRDVR